jgi:hypothetical protein
VHCVPSRTVGEGGLGARVKPISEVERGPAASASVSQFRASRVAGKSIHILGVVEKEKALSREKP